jgi:hypothetical protein
MRKHCLSIGMASLLVLAACGGDDKVDPKADATSAQKAFDNWEAKIKKDGFEKSPGDDTSDDSDATDASDSSDSSDDLKLSGDCEKFESAFGGDDLNKDKSAKEKSGQFQKESKNSEEDIQLSLILTKSKKSGDDTFKLLKDDKLDDCLKDAVVNKFEEEFDSADFKSSALDLGKVGDDRVGITLKGNISVQGQDVPAAFNFAFAREDRAAVSLLTSVSGTDKFTIDSSAQLQQVLDDATKK